ncbi:MAG: carbohydrate kinase family protein [Treponema sp.]|jgi:sugar/nucleoside kinase (ribokinase family)|nr:carbohydrate kinase family protein [Treponema sp.]
MDILEKSRFTELARRTEEIKSKRVLAGFDGFIDAILKPLLRSGDGHSSGTYFKTLAEFGTYIGEHSNTSASIEMDLIERRMGGNMPNFAGAIAALGVDLSCIGMLSDHNGEVDPVFLDLPGEVYSFAPAGTAMALEFNDGKLFLAPRYTLEESPWPLIENACRFPKPRGELQRQAPRTGVSPEELLRGADLIACLNWGELSFMDGLWRGLFDRCASLFSRDKKKLVFFDLADFSRRTPAEIQGVLTLIERFSSLRTTILSLNRNEALLLGEHALKTKAAKNAGIAQSVSQTYAIDEVLIHSHEDALVYTGRKAYAAETIRCPSPKISTGAGDHFNAAYAFAALMGLCFEDRLQFANQYAYTYVSTGIRPNLKSL